MLVKKITQISGGNPLAHLPQHPSCSFLNQIVAVSDITLGNLHGRAGHTNPQKPPGGHNSDTLFPQVIRCRQTVQHIIFMRIRKMCPYDVWSWQIHQIPVVGIAGMTQIEIHNFQAHLRITSRPLKTLHQS